MSHIGAPLSRCTFSVLSRRRARSVAPYLDDVPSTPFQSLDVAKTDGHADRVIVPETQSITPVERRRRLTELALLFLRLGSTTFGGPAVHLAVMEEEVVRRRRWLTPDEFLDLMGATQLLPGPNSTEMAIYIGERRAGGMGILVAGACFILPAVLLSGLLAWVYVQYGKLPDAAGLLAGVRPVIVAVIAQALYRFSRSALKSRPLTAVALVALPLCALGTHELAVLFGAGFAMSLLGPRRTASTPTAANHPAKATVFGAAGPTLVTGAAATGTAMAATAAPISLGPLFLAFLKAGGLLFGSGYVLLAYLRADLVHRLGWLTEPQLLDAIVAGQITPGPVFSTATFVGFLLAGWPGALVATLGIFAPAFALVAVSGRLMPRLRSSARAGAFLDGVNVASLALMAVVCGQIAFASLRSPVTIGTALAAAILLLRFRVNPTWLIVAGAAGGYLLR